MSRSLWKGPYMDNILFQKLIENNNRIYTTSRSSIITEMCIGKNIYVYNGKSFFKVNVLSSMVGKKLGSFVLTKKKVVFKKKKIKR